MAVHTCLIMIFGLMSVSSPRAIHGRSIIEGHMKTTMKYMAYCT